MREIDLNTIMHFVTRTEMYIGDVSENAITSFIRGYETGTNWECKFTKLISELLASNYDCRKMAMGWPGQIREYSNKRNLDWIIGFRQITLKYFYKTQDFSFESEFKSVLKSRITSKIDQINLNWVRTGFMKWSDEWIGLVDLNEVEFQSIWTETELKSLKLLNAEINRIWTDKTELTDRLLDLRNEYQAITKSNTNTL
ncbi:hypothetical protein [uncultured Psychroserpens sp.]|uniref:hypothetical protein n=1 Tax=uncultured Psychroserpens sp. TaxID=255436 RepID=UPI0026038519|nr:hypothetical protein [uncultured Psychroserpens sp.]